MAGNDSNINVRIYGDKGQLLPESMISIITGFYITLPFYLKAHNTVPIEQFLIYGVNIPMFIAANLQKCYKCIKEYGYLEFDQTTKTIYAVIPVNEYFILKSHPIIREVK